jgi:serpin B
LNEVLTALGMGIAFQPGQADLSGIGGGPGSLYISFVKQGTFVEVNEEGTEAAAATAVGVGIVCACGPREFRVDRPFVFAIRERFSGTILFAGRVMDPAS